ncbi:hypothetical protein GDO78_013432 [Eleutherodactylus coqui]|uniref:Uncharacterized protein n=1 Tax=Eleutherodactylus coqui TaxID=57060 RepID=A0A8J6F1C7_ELECQ|nr:hypothetical protein GDO78_013432 [Eleutherodactylus coqui]
MEGLLPFPLCSPVSSFAAPAGVRCFCMPASPSSPAVSLERVVKKAVSRCGPVFVFLRAAICVRPFAFTFSSSSLFFCSLVSLLIAGTCGDLKSAAAPVSI